MAKLKLSLTNLEGAEILTREQLKRISGGGSNDGFPGGSPNDLGSVVVVGGGCGGCGGCGGGCGGCGGDGGGGGTSPNSYTVNHKACLMSGDGTVTTNKVALYQIMNNGTATNLFAGYNTHVLSDNDGNSAAAGIDGSLYKDPNSGLYPTTLSTGLSGQNNYLDASQINYIALSSAELQDMTVTLSNGTTRAAQLGDYVAVTNNDPNSANYGKTFYGIIGDNSGPLNTQFGEMSSHFINQVFGTNNGVITSVPDGYMVNIMVANGSGSTTGTQLNLHANDGVMPTTQAEIESEIENDASAALGGSNNVLPYTAPPNGASATCN